jgi:hypothetical protein
MSAPDTSTKAPLTGLPVGTAVTLMVRASGKGHGEDGEGGSVHSVRQEASVTPKAANSRSRARVRAILINLCCPPNVRAPVLALHDRIDQPPASSRFESPNGTAPKSQPCLGSCPYRKHQRELRPPGAVLNHWARESRTGSGWPKRSSQKRRVHCELRESPMSAVSTDRGLIRLIRDVRRTANWQGPLRRLGVRTGGAVRQDGGWRPPDRVPAAESSVPLGCPWPARDVCGCRGSR